MKKLITILSMCIMSACAQNPVAPEGPARPEFVKSYNVFGTFTGRRIVFIHGIWGDATQFDSGWLGLLKTTLVQHGFQVVTFTYPNTGGKIFDDGGGAYREQYREFMKWMLDDLDTKFGVPTELDVAGFSFGGLHAMIAISLFPTRFTKWVAMVPVTNPTVTGLMGPYEAPLFNAFNEVPVLRAHPGFIQTSQLDNILGYQNAENLSHQIGNNFYMMSTSGILHDIDSNVINAIMGWL